MGGCSSKESAPPIHNSRSSPQSYRDDLSNLKAEIVTANANNDNNNNENRFNGKYSVSVVLGSGSYSVVKLATRNADKLKVAVKVLTKSKLSPIDEAALRSEVEILRRLDHPNIVKLIDFFDEEQYFYVVLEHLSGGELFEKLLEKEIYNENDARDVAVQILKAIKYCHDQDLIHRDVKPENLLLSSKKNDVDLKLVDFGFCIPATSSLVQTSFVGTPGYVAPEIIEKKTYGKAVDLWSFGIILFMLLGGDHPFFEEGDGQRELYQKIISAKFEFNDENWQNVSNEAKDLIRRLLTYDPIQRITAEEALMRHPWISKPSYELVAVNLSRSISLLKNYKTISLLRGNSAMAVADIAIDVMRKLSQTSVGKGPQSMNETVIDVARKVSNVSLNDAGINVVRKLSYTNGGMISNKDVNAAALEAIRKRSSAKIVGVGINSSTSTGSFDNLKAASIQKQNNI
eukprot:gene6844-9369_t